MLWGTKDAKRDGEVTLEGRLSRQARAPEAGEDCPVHVQQPHGLGGVLGPIWDGKQASQAPRAGSQRCPRLSSPRPVGATHAAGEGKASIPNDLLQGCVGVCS